NLAETICHSGCAETLGRLPDYPDKIGAGTFAQSNYRQARLLEARDRPAYSVVQSSRSAVCAGEELAEGADSRGRSFEHWQPWCSGSLRGKSVGSESDNLFARKLQSGKAGANCIVGRDHC